MAETPKGSKLHGMVLPPPDLKTLMRIKVFNETYQKPIFIREPHMESDLKEVREFLREHGAKLYALTFLEHPPQPEVPVETSQLSAAAGEEVNETTSDSEVQLTEASSEPIDGHVPGSGIVPIGHIGNGKGKGKGKKVENPFGQTLNITFQLQPPEHGAEASSRLAQSGPGPTSTSSGMMREVVRRMALVNVVGTATAGTCKCNKRGKKKVKPVDIFVQSPRAKRTMKPSFRFQEEDYPQPKRTRKFPRLPIGTTNSQVRSKVLLPSIFNIHPQQPENFLINIPPVPSPATPVPPDDSGYLADESSDGEN